MPTSLYEQFLAVGAVKSLLTGKEISPSLKEEETITKDQSSCSESAPEKHQAS